AGSPAPYLALLERFCERQALLVARWLGVGFIHGVMNTDNVSIAGETIDFGPCAFLDEYDPQKVFSSIDHMGRYAYGRQPGIAQWNVARFAETLLPLIAEDEDEAVRLATDAVNGFGTRFEAGWIDVMGKKLGLSQPCATDATLIRRLLGLMEAAGADFTLTFRWLADVVQAGYAPESLEAYLPPTEERASWLADWRARLANEGTETAIVNALRQTNPVFIPRNHQVERVIESAVSEGDFAPFEQLLSVLAHPFDERPEDAEYARPPEPHERVTRTFCGT
ncbi:MAG: protein adenylyltransferase SelO family protein, partial [Pseudomonadales bacterium]